jgi:hypothetical protein
MFIFMWWHNLSQVEVLVGWLKSWFVAVEMRGSILSNNIPNLVLHDYNMTTCVVNDGNMIICILNDYKMTTLFYFKCESTHNCFSHDLTPCHVELFEQVIWHDSSEHTHLIQYGYKSSCEHCCFLLKSY